MKSTICRTKSALDGGQERPLGTEAAFGLHGAVSEVESVDRAFCLVHTLLALHDLALGNEVWGFRM